MPDDTHFEPQTRKEISALAWFPLASLPAYADTAPSALAPVLANFVLANDIPKGGDPLKKPAFYLVAPFMARLRTWIKKHRRATRNAQQKPAALRPAPSTPTDRDDVESDGEALREFSVAIGHGKTVRGVGYQDAGDVLKAILGIGLSSLPLDSLPAFPMPDPALHPVPRANGPESLSFLPPKSGSIPVNQFKQPAVSTTSVTLLNILKPTPEPASTVIPAGCIDEEKINTAQSNLLLSMLKGPPSAVHALEPSNPPIVPGNTAQSTMLLAMLKGFSLSTQPLATMHSATPPSKLNLLTHQPTRPSSATSASSLSSFMTPQPFSSSPNASKPDLGYLTSLQTTEVAPENTKPAIVSAAAAASKRESVQRDLLDLLQPAAEKISKKSLKKSAGAPPNTAPSHGTLPHPQSSNDMTAASLLAVLDGKTPSPLQRQNPTINHMPKPNAVATALLARLKGDNSGGSFDGTEAQSRHQLFKDVPQATSTQSSHLANDLLVILNPNDTAEPRSPGNPNLVNLDEDDQKDDLPLMSPLLNFKFNVDEIMSAFDGARTK